MKHYLIVMLREGEDMPITGINGNTLFNDFDLAFDALENWALSEFGHEVCEHLIKRPKRLGPMNVTWRDWHLQIWETNIPER